MPTIDQLPVAIIARPTDEVPLDQAGTTRGITVGNLLAGLQPAISVATGTLLGRNSLGSGGPEAVAVGSGLALASGVLSATGSESARYAQRGALVVSDNAVLSTAAGPALIPLATLRGLFSAGTNIAIDANGVISAPLLQGPQGPVGATGASGTAGASWSAGGAAPLSTAGNPGDFYLNTATGAVFQKFSGIWNQIATLAGPQGPVGATGTPGATGAAGAPGTIWWTGTTAPLAGTGTNGDLFLNTVTGIVYQKSVSGNWTATANLKGPAGAGFITGTTTTTALGANDLVGLSQGGADRTLTAGIFGSLLPVTASIGSATTQAASLANRFGDFPNVLRDFGAPLNGTDASVAINAAIAAVAARGGGVVQIPNTGIPYMLAAPIVPLSGVCISGLGNPMLQLLPGANCAVIETPNFKTLFGSGSNSGVIKSVIEGLTLDGNGSTQSPANPDYANGISFFGPGVKIRRVAIQNVAGHGLVLGWGSGNPASNGVVEGVIEDVFVHGAGRTGVWFVGSHDSCLRDIIIRNASLSADSGYVGFRLDPGGSLRAFNLHAYNDPNLVQMSYAASIAGYSEFTDCHFEGAHQSLLIQGPYAKFSNCMIYNPQSPVSGTALVDLRASNAIFNGCGFFLNSPANASTPGTPMYAIAFGTASKASSGNVISGCTFGEFDARGPFNFINDGGFNFIDGTGSTTNAGGVTSFTGTTQSTTRINYRQSGTRIVYTTNATAGDASGLTGNGATLMGGASGSPVGLQAMGKDAGVHLFLAPKAYGSLIGAVPDGTPAGGGARGSNCVDWQMLRTNAVQVASGYAATLSGGSQNQAGGNYSVVPGGLGNITDSGYSEAGGNNSHTRGRQASRVWSSGSFSVAGDAQKGFSSLLRAVTTGGTPVYATTDMAAPGGYNNLQMQPNSVMSLRLRAIARDSGNGASALFISSDLLLVCGATHASISLTSGNSVNMALTQTTGNTTGWGITISVDKNTGGLLASVTGAAGRTIHWLVDPEFLEVI